jgi:biotin carboxylase
MKKIFIIGASILQLPAIKKAKEKGFIVAVADRDTCAVGRSYADEFYPISTIDVDKILKAATEFHADGIMTLATDMPMRAVANATTKLSLPGISIQTAEKATNKGKMMKAFKEHGVASPWYYVVRNDEELRKIVIKILYPCIIKPVDNAGSRGVILLNCEEELVESYIYSRNNSRNGEVIIEEYMYGDEVSVETMTINGVTHVIAITDKLTTGAPYFVEMGHSQQTKLSMEIREEIQKLAIRAINAIGIEIGPAHVEIMVTKDGPKIIELGARLGGDCIATHLVPLSTGVDMVGATIDILTGKEPDIKQKYNMGSAIRYFNPPKGRINHIDGINQAKKIDGVKEVLFTKQVGEDLSDITNSANRIGFVIAQGNDALDAIRICKKVTEGITIVTV